MKTKTETKIQTICDELVTEGVKEKNDIIAKHHVAWAIKDIFGEMMVLRNGMCYLPIDKSQEFITRCREHYLDLQNRNNGKKIYRTRQRPYKIRTSTILKINDLANHAINGYDIPEVLIDKYDLHLTLKTPLVKYSQIKNGYYYLMDKELFINEAIERYKKMCNSTYRTEKHITDLEIDKPNELIQPMPIKINDTKIPDDIKISISYIFDNYKIEDNKLVVTYLINLK